MSIVESLKSYMDTWRWDEGVTPMSHWTFPVFASVGYLLAIALIMTIMRNRKPFDLKALSVFHNGFLVVASFTMWAGVLIAAYDSAKEHGILGLFCEKTPTSVSGQLGFWVYIFHLSKYYEYLDTIIMALRKKPIIFLHMFHHAAVVPVTWTWLHDQWLVGAWWCTMVNSLVHTFMYYYYLQTALGRDVWWKRFITVGQLFQFFTGFLVVSFWFAVRNQPSYQCQGGLHPALLSHSCNIALMYMFGKFYYKTYVSGPRARSKKVE